MKSENFKKYLQYEFLMCVYSESGNEEKEIYYQEEGANIWYELTDKEREIIKGRGRADSLEECLNQVIELIEDKE